FLEEWDCSLTPKAEAPPGRRGRLGGFLSRRTRMFPAQRERRPGKEVPPERARTNRRKKNGPLAGGMPEKTRRPASTKWNASACLWLRPYRLCIVENETAESLPVIDSQKITRPANSGSMLRQCRGAGILPARCNDLDTAAREHVDDVASLGSLGMAFRLV